MDLERAVRALCEHFKADAVIIVGSQAILAIWPDAPPLLRLSGEIDAYPENAKLWELMHPERGEASEEINALFGEGSDFHRSYGFYIDGVDETTATLPSDWRSRSVRREVDCYGRRVFAIAPDPQDLILSKLVRLDQKDREFVEEMDRHGRVEHKTLLQRLGSLAVTREVRDRAAEFVSNLQRRSQQ